MAPKITVLVVMATLAAEAGAVGGLADITIYDRVENRTLPVYTHEGRYYVIGRPGNEYQVQLRNRGGGEVLAVTSVDGVNAVSGETANWNQTGYVLAGYQAFDLRGWRKSMDRIAAFYFTQHGNSYAARTGRPDNVGVIGVALFRKRYEPPVRVEPPPLSMRREDSPFPRSSDNEAPAARDFGTAAQARARGSAAADAAPERSDKVAGAHGQDKSTVGIRGFDSQPRPAPSMQPPAAAGPLGTGHGRSETSPVTYTSFQRASSSPVEIVTIHYDTYDNLVAQGVIIDLPSAARAAPTPFPGQFVPDPR